MVGLAAIALLLGAGWLSSRGLEIRLAVRAMLTWTLGLSLWAAWGLLVGQFLEAPSSTVLGGGIFASLWAFRMGPASPRVTRYRPALLALFALMAIAGWLHIVGGLQLRPSQELLVFDLPKIAQWAAGNSGATHPLGIASESSVSPLAKLASVWGSDPLRPLLLFGGLAQIGTLWLWFWLGAHEQAKAPLATALGGLALFLGTSSGWMLVSSPWLALSYLLVLAAIVLATVRGPVWALPNLLAVGLLSPELALAGLLYFLGCKGSPRALLFLGLSAVSVLWYGGSWGVLVAAFLYIRTTKGDVRGLCLASLAYPGAPEWAALGIAVGRALTAVWRRTPVQKWGFDGGLVVPKRAPLVLLTLVAFWRALIAGEEVYNDDILIRSQKEKVSLSRLLVPHTLLDWAAWRGAAVGFEQEDLKALPLLAEEGDALYQTGDPVEPVEVAALLSALSGGRPLAGWYASARGVSPYPAVAAYFSTGERSLLRATPIRRLLRRGQPEVSIEPWPKEAEAGQAATAVAARFEKWGELLWFRADGATGYQVEIDGVPFGEAYPVRQSAGQEIPYVPPRIAGDVALHWEHGMRETPPIWPLQAELKTAKELPTRSLLNVELELENASAARLELTELRGLRWTLKRLLSTRPDEISPVVPLQPLVIEPNSTKTLNVSFRTPPEMGTYKVELEMFDELGNPHQVAFRTPLVIRTWRRNPLVAVPDGVVKVEP